MRGHTRCRSHRDRELGPRGGGAPPGNLNALKTGEHAHPLSPNDLRLVASQVVRQPHQLPDHLDLIVRSIHSRTSDPYNTLVALRAALSDLMPQVAVALFKTELDAQLRRIPPSQRGPLLRAVNKRLRCRTPEAALLSLRDTTFESEKSQKNKYRYIRVGQPTRHLSH
jgi:hypothetical protein